APAGFGKTTLVAEWLRHLSGEGQNGPSAWACAWLSLDAEDNQLARFVSYLLAALNEARAGLGAEALALLECEGRSPAQIESALTHLLNELATARGHVLLVLDDYHLIEEGAIHQALAFLLEHLPATLHLVIASRTDPPLPLARLRARGQLTEIRAADLRFTPNEAASFLNQIMGLSLSARDIAVLAGRTEGWAAGLQLAALSMQGRPPQGINAFVAAFGGSHRHIMDYLADEVMAQQPIEIHDFLCQTSLLDQLTAPLCDAVTGRDDSYALLHRLERANLFLVPLDDQGLWYRYHHLFAEFLRNHLRHDQRDLIPALHRRASDWYARHGMTAEAIEHALQADDMGRAADLIERTAEATLMHSEIGALLRWADALPDAVVSAHPTLCVYYAWALLLAGRPLREVEAHIAQADADQTGAPTYLAPLRALIAILQGNVALAVRVNQEALQAIPPDNPFLRDVVTWCLGMCHSLRGDLNAAIQSFERAGDGAQRAGNPMIAVIAHCHVAEMLIQQGQLKRAWDVYQHALDLASPGGGEDERLPIAGSALLGLGEVARHWGRVEEAERYLTQGLALTRRWGEIGTLDAYISLARLKLGRGELQVAREYLDEAGDLAARFDATELDDTLVELHAAQLAIAEGDLPAAERWAERQGLGASPTIPAPDESDEAFFLSHVMREAKYLTHARLLLARDQPLAAIRMLDQLLPVARQQGRVTALIEMLALRALALWMAGRAVEALMPLEEALALGEPEGFVASFADVGPEMARLLYEAASQGMAPVYIGRLLSAMPSPSRPPEAEALVEKLVEPLSEREVEVLQLVAEGLSNARIAQRLSITVRTVKWHTSNIYGKLNVTSRTQAIVKARMLGILPAT
ncbi:MAG: AAA family ATPase, partial [Anaerolineae bacterium]|nr:AAA family ATPase [Anaerolineae bacterium]